MAQIHSGFAMNNLTRSFDEFSVAGATNFEEAVPPPTGLGIVVSTDNDDFPDLDTEVGVNATAGGNSKSYHEYLSSINIWKMDKTILLKKMMA
jgi:hypothetical protein